MIKYFVKYLYWFLTLLLGNLFYLYLKLKKNAIPYGKEITELKGVIKKEIPQNPIWFHTVSVGETKGALPLIKRFLKESSENIVVTTLTTTSKNIYLKELPNTTHLFAPLDSPLYVARFFKKVQPKALIIMETELWPNTLAYAKKHNIPVIIINARLSNKSMQKYKKLGSIFNKLISDNLTKIICQNQNDYDNFANLEIPNSKLCLSGSLKFDIEPNYQHQKNAQEIRKIIGNKKVVCLASTHDNEEELFINSFKNELINSSNLMLIIVPRHPERFNQIINLSKDTNLNIATRSENNINNQTQIFIGNSMGELELYFALSDLIIMGGSFTDIGGHNPLEAIALNKPVLTGKYYYNFKTIFEELFKANGSFIIDENNITSQIIDLISDENKLYNLSNNAYLVFKSKSGAINKTLIEINQCLNQINTHD